MSAGEPTAEASKTYDLYLHAEGSGFHWRVLDQGVTLTRDRMAWAISGQAQEARYTSVAMVRLHTGGVPDAAIAMCEITFVDGYVLTVFNGNSGNTPDSAQADIYRAFVRDLHARLAASKASVQYIAGFPGRHYKGLVVAVSAAVLLFIVLPVVLLFMTGDPKVLYLLFVGAGLAWPMIKIGKTNVPATYNPKAIPGELLV